MLRKSRTKKNNKKSINQIINYTDNLYGADCMTLIDTDNINVLNKKCYNSSVKNMMDKNDKLILKKINNKLTSK